MRVMIPEVLGCLDGMTVTLTADAVETDDLTKDKSEGSPPIKVLQTQVARFPFTTPN
jgi:hypothetical protein